MQIRAFCCEAKEFVCLRNSWKFVRNQLGQHQAGMNIFAKPMIFQFFLVAMLLRNNREKLLEQS